MGTTPTDFTTTRGCEIEGRRGAVVASPPPPPIMSMRIMSGDAERSTFGLRTVDEAEEPPTVPTGSPRPTRTGEAAPAAATTAVVVVAVSPPPPSRAAEAGNWVEECNSESGRPPCCTGDRAAAIVVVVVLDDRAEGAGCEGKGVAGIRRIPLLPSEEGLGSEKDVVSDAAPFDVSLLCAVTVVSAGGRNDDCGDTLVTLLPSPPPPAAAAALL